jgi:hypothetical protein
MLVENCTNSISTFSTIQQCLPLWSVNRIVDCFIAGRPPFLNCSPESRATLARTLFDHDEKLLRAFGRWCLSNRVKGYIELIFEKPMPWSMLKILLTSIQALKILLPFLRKWLTKDAAFRLHEGICKMNERSVRYPENQTPLLEFIATIFQNDENYTKQ